MTTPGGTDRPDFDPRHDAIYQRGYRPGDASRSPAGPPRTAAQQAAVAPASAPDRSIDRTATSPGEPFDDLVLPAFDGDNFTDEPERSRVNPYIALLWVIGVVLPVGGLVLQWQSVQGMFGNTSWSGNGEPPIGMVLQQFSYLAAPPLISAGILILAGLLFWHASAWRARRRGDAGA